MRRVLKLASKILLASSLLSATAYADWVLDNNKSALYFVSIKNQNNAETHTFKTLSGTIDNNGTGSLSIDLTSVDSNIAIRNQRLRELLFMTDKFATTTVSIDLRTTGIKAGIQTINATLELHGVKKDIPATLAVTLVNNSIEVATVAPIILSAADFGLDGGITTLREIASLQSISNAVPVTFFLSFTQQP